MAFRVINNKRIDLTNDEWRLYQEICKSYDRPNFKGSDLFAGLFETDDGGIITYLKPPTQYTSMEVFLFMMCVMQHQHLRIMYSKVDEAIADCKKTTASAEQLIFDMKKGREST